MGAERRHDLTRSAVPDWHPVRVRDRRTGATAAAGQDRPSPRALAARSDGPPLNGRDALPAVALAAVAVALRAGGLAPPSLWLDDTWVALVTRADSLAEVLRVSTTTPGFTVLLKGWSGVVGFSEAGMQAIPFAAGIATPPALYVLLRYMGLPWGPAGLGGLVLALSPVHARYSVAVKQYTLDAAATVALLWLAWRVLRRPEPRRWWLLAGGGVAATAMSMSAAVVASGSLLAALCVTWLRRGSGAAGLGRDGWTAGLWRDGWAAGLLPAAGYGLCVLALWGAVVRQHVNDAVFRYWRGAFLETPPAAARSLSRLATGVLGGDGSTVTVLVATLVVVALVVTARARPRLAWLVSAPLVVAVTAALAGRVPLAPAGPTSSSTRCWRPRWPQPSPRAGGAGRRAWLPPTPWWHYRRSRPATRRRTSTDWSARRGAAWTTRHGCSCCTARGWRPPSTGPGRSPSNPAAGSRKGSCPASATTGSRASTSPQTSTARSRRPSVTRARCGC